MNESIFEHPEQVAEALGLPCAVSFSVIGEAGDAYRDRLLAMVEDLFGPEALREHTTRQSRQGTYHAYRLTIQMETIDQVETFYHSAGALEGTRSVM